MQTRNYKVVMRCSSCAMILEGLEDLSGIEKVIANYKKEQLEIVFDETMIAEVDILEAIEKGGYQVSP